ncbi:MAG TPA: hypothetical protein VGL80_22485 [Pseudonocardiaceae bacterium]
MSEVSTTTVGSVEDLCAAAVAVLGTDRSDVPFALVYLCEPDGSARLVASAGILAGSPAAPLTLPDVPELVAGRLATRRGPGSRNR